MGKLTNMLTAPVRSIASTRARLLICAISQSRALLRTPTVACGMHMHLAGPCSFPASGSHVVPLPRCLRLDSDSRGLKEVPILEA